VEQLVGARHGDGQARLERLLLAAAVGMAALSAWPLAQAQAPSVQHGTEAPRQEVVVTATRRADAAVTAKVEQALHDDPYIFADHLSVVTENGIVTVQGIAFDVGDLHRALMLARRVAGRRRVVNEVELVVDIECHD
jgi:osmotically-inducible protein OsmY